MLYVLYGMEPIGVDGELEATTVDRYCSPECRDAALADKPYIKVIFGGEPALVLEKGDAGPKYLNPADAPVILKKGTEQSENDGELCICGKFLDELPRT